MAVHFSFEDCDFDFLDEKMMKEWINRIVQSHKKQLGRINYLFCTDEIIYKTNVKFLDHDTYTDIITFDYVEGNSVSGDILISVDRVGENAHLFMVPFEKELCRVIIHGVLHLLGFKDKTEEDALQMRAKEEESLAVLDDIKKTRCFT